MDSRKRDLLPWPQVTMLLALLLLLLLLSPDSQTAHGHPLYTRLSPGTLQGEPGWSEEATGMGGA